MQTMGLQRCPVKGLDMEYIVPPGCDHFAEHAQVQRLWQHLSTPGTGPFCTDSCSIAYADIHGSCFSSSSDEMSFAVTVARSALALNVWLCSILFLPVLGA